MENEVPTMKERNLEALVAQLTWMPQRFQGGIHSVGTQAILRGILMHMEKTKPSFRRMTRKKLAAAAAQYLADYDSLVEIVSREYPPGAAFLKGQTDLMTASILGQLAAALSAAQKPRWGEW
ncbi:hypothetical protein A9R16_003435 [Acidiferrobacter thiooxydans]|uniref:hypothetical protein n=1 Tax=Acidiferrobacter thiooxydans TaxID=163359 RepID=UPI000825E17A|nr:hypothetical protein [Acidiferrobacter thiooxydans]UEO00467.1 hypothetical protein A9R16_003435 [Acidiferrobacter thiooxydans]